MNEIIYFSLIKVRAENQIELKEIIDSYYEVVEKI